MTLSNLPSVLQQALAFKAYEIEELADVYFFRPLGAVIAHSAKVLGLTPTHLTLPPVQLLVPEQSTDPRIRRRSRESASRASDRARGS